MKKTIKTAIAYSRAENISPEQAQTMILIYGMGQGFPLRYLPAELFPYLSECLERSFIQEKDERLYLLNAGSKYVESLIALARTPEEIVQ